MIKIDTNGKIISFDIDVEGGSYDEIREGRFIISCPNKTYQLMFEALIENGTITIDIPPLDINEKFGECVLEVISNDNQYYPILKDKIKFSRGLTIKVKEQKEIKEKIVKLSENKKEMGQIKEEILKSSEMVDLYRTIKCDESVINEILSRNKFSMKPKENVNVKFYDNDSMLINDIEEVEYGICIKMLVPNNGIIKENKDHTLIVDSSYLDNINEKNVLFLINNGKIIQLKRNENENI